LEDEVKKILSFLSYFWLLLFFGQISFAQSSNQAQPLNANVSGFGTSFVFSPAPVCSGCVQTELGFSGANGGRFLPFVFTAAPPKSRTDFTVLVNVLDSQLSSGGRTNHLGDRFDLIVRQQVVNKGGLILTVAPRGAFFVRNTEGGRVGATFAGQYGKGKNVGVINLTMTRAVRNTMSFSQNNYQGSFDYSRNIGSSGLAVFAGFLHEAQTGATGAVGIEQGIVLPFKNGQIEFAAEQLNLTGKVMFQFQARIIVNWNKALRW
jgi:hypothetical protein